MCRFLRASERARRESTAEAAHTPPQIRALASPGLADAAPMIRVVTADSLRGTSAADVLGRVFTGARKGGVTVIVLDDVERLVGAVAQGASLSAGGGAVQLLTSVLHDAASPAGNGRLVLIGTTGAPALLRSLGLFEPWRHKLHVPLLNGTAASAVLADAGVVPAAADAPGWGLGPSWRAPVRDALQLASVLRRPDDAGGAATARSRAEFARAAEELAVGAQAEEPGDGIAVLSSSRQGGRSFDDD